MDTKTLCLGVLTLGKASGYDIKKYLSENFGHFMDVSVNAVYPALKWLEREEHVTYKIVKQGSYHAKKVYTLTTKGEKYFEESLKQLEPRHKVRSQLMLLLFFADNLSADKARSVIDARLTELTHWMTVCTDWDNSDESTQAGYGPSFLTKYAIAIMDAEIQFLNNHSENFINNVGCKS